MEEFSIGSVVVWSEHHDEGTFSNPAREVTCEIVSAEKALFPGRDGNIQEVITARVVVIADTEGHLLPGKEFHSQMDHLWRLVVSEEDKKFGVVGVHGNER